MGYGLCTNYETEKEKIYHWKEFDFINANIKIIEVKSFKNMLNKGIHLQIAESLILHVSKLLIINENNGLISFSCGFSKLGFTEIAHFTRLMKRINNHWVKTVEYPDGVIN